MSGKGFWEKSKEAIGGAISDAGKSLDDAHEQGVGLGTNIEYAEPVDSAAEDTGGSDKQADETAEEPED